jgi:hypothetical protein
MTESERIARDNRARELNRMSKRGLLFIMRLRLWAIGVQYVIGGPHLWSKDELIAGILALEYPTETGASHDKT